MDAMRIINELDRRTQQAKGLLVKYGSAKSETSQPLAEFDKTKPITMQFGEKTYDITHHIDSTISIDNPAINGPSGLLDHLALHIANLRLAAHREALSAEAALTGYTPNEVERTSMIKDIKTEANTYTQKLSEHWDIDDVPAQKTEITISENGAKLFTVQVVTIGQKAATNEQWAVPLLAARAILKLRLQFGNRLIQRKAFTIYDLREYVAGEDWNDQLAEKSAHELHAGGIHLSPGIIMISPHATIQEGRDQLQNIVIKSTQLENLLRHELGHELDPYQRAATTPQSEAFAVLCESDFNFQKILKGLRTNGAYTRQVTLEQLATLMEDVSNAPGSVLEKYLLSGTLYAYVFKQLGSDKLMDFYGFLSGGLGTSPRYPKAKFDDFTNLQGNIIRSLKMIGSNIPGFSADKFIHDYLEKINEDVK